MQLTSPRGNIVEKIVRDENGQLVRATFCVYEVGGRMQVRLLQAVLIRESATPLALKGFTLSKIAEPETVALHGIVSPFTYSDLLYFSGSKPRAPTF